MKIIKHLSLVALIGLLTCCEAKDVDGELRQVGSTENNGGGSNQDIGCVEGDDLLSDGDLLNRKILITSSGDSSNSGKISYIDRKGVLIKNLFQTQNNGNQLGINVNALASDKGKTLIAVDSRLVTVNSCSFENPQITDESGNSVNVVLEEGMAQARDIIVDGNTGYVCNWGIDELNGTETPYIANIDLSAEWATYNAASSLALNTLKPEKMILQSGKLFLTHVNSDILSSIATAGGAGALNELSLRDFPIDLIQLSNGNIGVLSGGNVEKQVSEGFTVEQYHACIYEINPETNSIEKSFKFPAGNFPTALYSINNEFYYALDGQVQKLSPNATEVAPDLDGVVYDFDVKITDMAIEDDILYGVLQPRLNSEALLVAAKISTKEELVNLNTGGVGNNKIYIFE